MSTFKPIAPIEPDTPFDEDGYDNLIGAIDDLLGEDDEDDPALQEAFSPDQPRYPRGHAKAGQWRPKLSTGAGRIAPGHLDRDLFALQERVRAVNNLYTGAPPQHVLNEIGTDVEKTALRYSARKHYEQRLSDIRTERGAIQDRRWEAWADAWRNMTPGQKNESDPNDFLTTAESTRLKEIADEEVRLTRERDRADRDAMLGVLEKIRPMGGTLNQAKISYAVDQASGIERDYIEAGQLHLGPHAQMPGLARKAMKDDLDKSLKEVLKVVPKAWLNDTNSKGEVSWLFSKDRAWADTRRTEEKRPKDDFREMEDGVDQALKGELPRKLVGQAAVDVMGAKGDRLGRDKTPEEDAAWRARRDEEAQKLSDQKYTWVGRAGSPSNPNYPKGLWAVVKGEDGNRYYLDWGGNLHLMRKPTEDESAMTKANLSMPVLEGPREDRRIRNPPLSRQQQQAIDSATVNGGAYAGMYAERYPVVRRPGTEEGGIGPNAAIYDWVDDDGTMKNLQLDDTAPGGKYDETKWDRSAPQPQGVATSTDTMIKVDPREQATLMHELSHRLEVVYGEPNMAGYNPISVVTHAFLNGRTAGEEPQRLQDLYPGYAYEDHEMAKADQFIDGYIGKLYPGQVTEVLTMGMDMLWFPRFGNRDINKDPEMRRLILGIQATL